MNKSRPKKVTFRLSEDEHRQLQERISNSGLSSQEYILKAVLQTTVQSNTELKEGTLIIRTPYRKHWKPSDTLPRK